MSIFESLINGLSAGATYAIIALGYTMVYGIAKMLNFAHGDIIMVGGYMTFVAMKTVANPFLALGLSIVVCMLLGILIEKAAYKPLRGASPLAVLITAIGVSNLLQALAQIVFGPNDQSSNLPDLGNVRIGSAMPRVSTLITLAVSAVIMVALTLFVKYTRTGRAMVAVSEDRDAAQLMGVDVNKIITITFAIGSALAAVAGFFLLWNTFKVTPTAGSMPGIKAFAAAVIGGIGSIPGAMVGGLLLGVVEAFSEASFLKDYTTAIEFLILILILLVRPTGLMGKKRREKV